MILLSETRCEHITLSFTDCLGPIFLDEMITMKSCAGVSFSELIQKVELSGKHNTTRASVMLHNSVV
jgi:hypothetical protein